MRPSDWFLALSTLALTMVVVARAQTPAPANRAPGLTLPDGTGRELVQRTCSECHALERILGTRENRDGWVQIVNDMASRGAIATDEEFDQIVAYLVEHFGRPARPARPNLQGIWTLVGTGASRLGPQFTIAQSDTAITVTAGARTMMYTLTGTDGDTAKWDGAKLVLTSRLPVNGKPAESTSTWSVDPSGNLIIEEMTPDGLPAKATYKRDAK